MNFWFLTKAEVHREILGFSELSHSGCPQKSCESSSCLALACTHSGSGNKTVLFLKSSSWRVDWCEIVALSPKRRAREGQCDGFVGEEVALSCGIMRVLSLVSIERFLSCPKITSEENQKANSMVICFFQTVMRTISCRKRNLVLVAFPQSHSMFIQSHFYIKYRKSACSKPNACLRVAVMCVLRCIGGVQLLGDVKIGEPQSSSSASTQH